MQNHNNDTNKDERHSSLEKIYPTLYLKGFEKITKGFTVWEVSWRLNRTATYWPPTLMAITAFLSRSSRLLNREPGGPASLGRVSHSSIFAPTATAQSGVLRAPSSGCWFSLPHLISNWLNFLCTKLYNNLTSTLLPANVTISHLIQPVHGQGYILILLDRMHLLFTQVHFLFWQLGQVGGQYTTLIE